MEEGIPKIEKEKFSVVQHPAIFLELEEKLLDFSTYCISGFEDIIDDNLGVGRYINHVGSVAQLIFCLSVSNNPEIKNILEKNIPKIEIIKLMREKKILSGMKILDLGCGNYPYFLLVASSLGAIAIGADADYLSSEALKQGGFNYEQIDLRDLSNIEIKNYFQKYGSFDVITENIIGVRPGQLSKLGRPNEAQIKKIAELLLKPGGYLFSEEVGGMFDRTSLQKI